MLPTGAEESDWSEMIAELSPGVHIETHGVFFQGVGADGITSIKSR